VTIKKNLGTKSKKRIKEKIKKNNGRVNEGGDPGKKKSKKKAATQLIKISGWGALVGRFPWGDLLIKGNKKQNHAKPAQGNPRVTFPNRRKKKKKKCILKTTDKWLPDGDVGRKQ